MVWKLKEGLNLCMFGGIVFLLMLPIIIAASYSYNTYVEVQTEANKDLVVKLTDVNNAEISKNFPIKTNSLGVAKVNFGTNSGEVNVMIYFISNRSLLLKEENIIKIEEAGVFSSSEPILIDLNELETVNETINETEEVLTNETLTNETINETEEEILEEVEESKIVGFTVFGEEGLLSGKRIYYLFGALFILIIGYISLKLIRKNLHLPKNIKVRKMSEIANKSELNTEDKIKDAEKKIKEAQDEIKEIRDEEKIIDAERKIEEDKEKLERLKRGEE